ASGRSGDSSPARTIPEQRAPAPAPTSNPILSAPLEMQLATVDGVADDPVKVARFKSLLGQLDEAYVENPKQIADTTVKGHEILRGKGVSESLLNMMEGMNRVFDATFKNQKYAEYMAAYLTLRDKGQSHAEAVHGLHSLIGTILNPGS